MRQFPCILSLLLLVLLQLDSKAQETGHLFTIYLVRHSEKELNGNHNGDPPLTECGRERSEHLNTFLSHVTLDAIYSTDYTRTRQTAQPTATSKEMEILEYSPGDLEGFAQNLIELKQDALVVGHSNTTGVLAGILTGEELGAFDESIYNRIYQVVISEKESRLHLLHTAFHCTE